MAGKIIKINSINRFYYIFQMKHYIKLADKAIKYSTMAINYYLELKDPKKQEELQMTYKNSISNINMALERKSFWQALLIDLQENKVATINI